MSTKTATPRVVMATAEDIYGITWAVFSDGAYGSRFGNPVPWKDQDPDRMAESLVDHLATGGDEPAEETDA